MKTIMRTCKPGGKSHGGYVWPLEVGAVAVADDWDPKPECGGGLHGLLNGQGFPWLLNWLPDAVWIAAEPIGEVVDLEGKVKCRSARVLCVGDQETVTRFVQDRHPGARVVGASVVAGDYGVAITGSMGRATAGDGGSATVVGGGGSAIAGREGEATVGDFAAALAGDKGVATAGAHGRSVVGALGTAMVGNHGAAYAGFEGKAAAGYGGVLSIAWWEGGTKERPRLATAYVGEDGIAENTLYRVEGGRFVEAKSTKGLAK